MRLWISSLFNSIAREVMALVRRATSFPLIKVVEMTTGREDKVHWCGIQFQWFRLVETDAASNGVRWADDIRSASNSGRDTVKHDVNASAFAFPNVSVKSMSVIHPVVVLTILWMTLCTYIFFIFWISIQRSPQCPYTLRAHAHIVISPSYLLHAPFHHIQIPHMLPSP